MNSEALLTYFHDRQSTILATIGQLVTHETPSTDKAQLDAFAALLAERYAAAGASVEVIPNATRGQPRPRDLPSRRDRRAAGPGALPL